MRWTSAYSDLPEPRAAVQEALESLFARHEGRAPDLIALFLAGFDPDSWDAIIDRIIQACPRAVLVGCAAEGVLASDREILGRPAIALCAATLPGVSVTGFHLDQAALEEPVPWSAGLLPPVDDEPILLAFADPFSIDVRTFLSTLATTHPGTPVVGGFASHGREPLSNGLFLNGERHRTGLVGLAMHGALRADLLVSQGCRPVGRHFVVTQCDGQWIRGLRGRPAVEVLREMVSELPERDLHLASEGLLIGRAIDEYKSQFDRGDFLIQGILGAEKDGSALAVAGEVRLGATMQFHVRDAEAADEDLRSLCALLDDEYAGALAFTCNGRGPRMWDTPDHDVAILQHRFGPLPLAGFFAAGEIGPIGGQNFVHGFTISAALFRPA